MSWTVSFSSRALHDLKRLDRQTRIHIVDAIERHAATGAGDVKRLRGRDRGWRLRVGDWRVLHRGTASMPVSWRSSESSAATPRTVEAPL